MRNFTVLTLLAVLVSSTLSTSALAKENKENKPDKFDLKVPQIEAQVEAQADLELTVEAETQLDVDLYVKDLAYDASTMTLSYKVGNQGSDDVDANGDGSLDLTGENEVYLDGELLIARSWALHHYSSNVYLQAGGEFTRPLLMYQFEEWDQVPHDVKVCVNTTEVVDESNWDNNCISKRIIKTGSALPDLSVEEAYVSMEADGTATLHYSLQNDSDISVVPVYNGYTTVEVNGEVLQNSLWQEDSEYSLWMEAGAGVHRSINLGSVEAEESYTAKVCVDSENGIQEKDEDNNCVEVEFEGQAEVDPGEEEMPEDFEDLLDWLEENHPDVNWIVILHVLLTIET